MFTLTKPEMYVVAFLIGAVLVGAVVRQVRDHRAAANIAADVKEP
jgi:hypothetical protein